MKTIVICHIPNDFDYYKSLMEDYSKKLSSIKALKLPPHLTIVSRFKSERYEDFIEALEKEVSNYKSFNLITDNINFFENPSILKINFIQSEELKELHSNFLDLTLEFREDWARKSLSDRDISEEKKVLVERYGSPFVKQFYNPHMTLAGEDVNPEVFKEITSTLPKELNKTLLIDHINIMLKTDDGWVVDKAIPLK